MANVLHVNVRPLKLDIQYSYGSIREYPTRQNMNCASSLLHSLMNWGAVHLVGQLGEQEWDIKIHLPTICAITGKKVEWARLLVRELARHHFLDLKVTPFWESEWETLKLDNYRKTAIQISSHLVFEIIRVSHCYVPDSITLNRPFDRLISRFEPRSSDWTYKLPCEHFARLVIRCAAKERASSHEEALQMIRKALKKARRMGERVVKDDKNWIILSLPNARVTRLSISRM